MKLSLKSAPKWLFIPPVVALLLILGPMSMGGKGDKTESPTTTAQPTPAQTTASKPGLTGSALREPSKTASFTKPRSEPGSLVPRTPNMWKMTSAFIGVLLLGVGAVMVLKKLRGGATPQRKASLATLRQTVRLTTKQSLHAIEFDNRILLIGETDKGLTLIDRGSLPEAVSDEATVLARHQQEIVEEEADDGAVPRNLLIPRPETPPQVVRTPAATTNRVTPSATISNVATPSKADAAIAKLNDFRTLLEKAGR